MYQIKDGVWLSLEFDDVEFPLGAEALSFQRVTMIQNRRQFLPTIEIVLSDTIGFLTTKCSIKDGVKIRVSIGERPETKKTYQFRLYRFSADPVGGSTTYTILGYLDTPKYILKTRMRPVTGTSSVALKTIASEAGMTFSGDATTDSMTWWPSNDRLAVWAEKIACYGYAGNTSLMKLAVTAERQMRYRNIASPAFLREPRVAFVRSDTSATNRRAQIINDRVINASGYLNLIGGYAHTHVQSTTTGESVKSEKLTVNRLSREIAMGDDVKSTLNTQGRVTFGPVDCGNVHQYYEQAYYQNERGALVWSSGVEVLIQSQLDATLLDIAQYASSTQGSESEELKAFSGLYLITAKTIQIEGSNYYEKYQLYSTGVNA